MSLVEAAGRQQLNTEIEASSVSLPPFLICLDAQNTRMLFDKIVVLGGQFFAAALSDCGSLSPRRRTELHTQLSKVQHTVELLVANCCFASGTMELRRTVGSPAGGFTTFLVTALPVRSCSITPTSTNFHC